VDEILKCDHSNGSYCVLLSFAFCYAIQGGCIKFLSLRLKSIQMKATEQYFPVVLFIMLYKVVLAFQSVSEILKCDHSNESY